MSFILGILVCGAALAIVLTHGGSPMLLFDARALMLVTVGSLGMMFVISPFKVLCKHVRTVVGIITNHDNVQKLIPQIMELVSVARKNGVLALEGREGKVDNVILKKGLILISSSADRESIGSILEEQAGFFKQEEKEALEFVERLEIMSPVIGMLGTLLEIVQMLFAYKGPQTFAPGVARALLPFVYGAIIAYLIIMPLASRIKSGSGKLAQLRELAIMGVMAIQAGEPPYIVEERLNVFTGGKSVRDRRE